MAKGFFITGTDTAVGKTIVAGALIKALRREKLSVCCMKPIETGCRRVDEVLIPEDGMFLKEIAGMKELVTDIVPYCLESPLAPMMAAETEGVEIDPDIIKKSFDVLVHSYDAAIVEGIGGLFVPIKRGFFVSDLAFTFRLPVIVVASPFLGTINQTLLTVDYALKSGLDVTGIIINYRRPSEGTLAEETNPGAIERLSPVPLLGVMPYQKDLYPEKLGRAARKHLDMKTILKSMEP